MGHAALFLPALHDLDVHPPEGMDWFVNLRPTMLDDTSWFAPFVETFTGEKLPWAAHRRCTATRHSADGEYEGLVKEFAEKQPAA